MVNGQAILRCPDTIPPLDLMTRTRTNGGFSTDRL